MRARISVLTLLFTIATIAHGAGSIYTTVDLTGYTLLMSTGTASYRNESSDLQGHSMSGWLAIGPCLFPEIGKTLWTTGTDNPAASWTGTVTCWSIMNECHQGRIDASSNEISGLTQGAGSSHICITASVPPPMTSFCLNADCNDPLVLDLNGDGIHTTSSVVWFDMDGDGTPEQNAWTDPDTEEGFLYLDLDHKGRVTDGSELFGVGTVMPDGSRGHDGFSALAVYDRVEHGGNADGIMSKEDAVWNRLRLWVDANHDGRCNLTETGPLHAYHIEEISLAARPTNVTDAAGNFHAFASEYRSKNGQHAYAIHAIGFQHAP